MVEIHIFDIFLPEEHSFSGLHRIIQIQILPFGRLAQVNCTNYKRARCVRSREYLCK